MMKTALILLFSLTFIASNAYAQNTEPKLIGKYGEWAAYSFTENGDKVCYMAAEPKTAKGNYKRRGDIYALITHRPGEGTKNVFSYITGYTYKTASDVDIAIGSKKFILFTQDNTAWTPDAATDNRLAEAIRAGSKMVVKGTSSRGTLTTDTFSLTGSANAHDAITKACNL